MKYRYRVWCDDCQMYNYTHGCFLGESELSDETFDTFKEADEAGSEYVDCCGLWDYCVTDEDGKRVEA